MSNTAPTTSPAEQPFKKYPLVTPEVAKMFGLPNHAIDFGQGNTPAKSAAVEPPAGPDLTQVVGNLYIKQPHGDLPQPVSDSHASASNYQQPAAHGTATEFGHGHGVPLPAPAATSRSWNILKTVTPYVAVFSVALFVYFYFFSGSGINFGKPASAPAPTPSIQQSSLDQLEQQNYASFEQWIAEFYYDISDPKIVDPNVDNSGNGLSNFQKYLLNLNPKSYDSLGLGMSDSDALQAGINPLTGSALSDVQKTIVNKYFDFEVISNRETLAQMQRSGQVAGAHTSYSSFSFGAQNAQAASTNPGQNPLVAGFGSTNNTTQPTNPAPAPTPTQPTGQTASPRPAPPVQASIPSGSTTTITPADLGVSQLDVDDSAPGRLQIPSLKVDAPLIWSTDPSNFDNDLQKGVIHYPGTALPGQIGTAYISGHSSNYSWAKGSYNHVFTHLNDLKDDASFSITIKTKDGQTHILHYVVVGRQQYDPGDQAQFKNGGQSVVALSTCWPVGSTKYRLVVFGQLTQVEN